MPAPVTRDLQALVALQEQFLASIGDVDPATPVPWCGRWRVSHLVVHLARVHHWAAAQARRTREAPLGRGPFDLAELYERCARELRDALAELDPAARAHTLLDDGVPRAEQRGTVAFWHRRQKLETLVHLWDLRTAGGLPPVLVHADVDDDEQTWWDAVDEVVTVMHPRQVRLGRTGAPEALLTLRRPGGVPLVLDGGVEPLPDAPRLTVEGGAQDLALLLWGRLAADSPRLRLTFDPDDDGDDHGDAAAGGRDAVVVASGLLATPLTP